MRVLVAVFAGLLVLVTGSLVWFRVEAGRSLPRLDGEEVVAGLSAAVTVERDALGIPTIRARTRLDAARALGFVHAQDRFFQMDLARRQAAGELAALVGAGAVPLDRRHRLHQFRERARQALAGAPAPERALGEAYAAGVNTGLAALAARPFEYLVLRAAPEPWRPEDTILVVASMYLMLQDQDGRRESRRGLMHDLLPPELFEFLTPVGSEWDAPLAGEARVTPPPPGPAAFDLRTGEAATALRAVAPRLDAPPATGGADLGGSNSWAVAGTRTADGGALVANDIHLPLDVPNIWYRAVLAWIGEDGEARRLAGVTLPGTPALVVGSNGYVAWSFTNSWADWTDLVVLEPEPDRPDHYRTPGGPRRMERIVETIDVKGADSVELEIQSTIWGPVIDRDHQERMRAVRWVAHDVEVLSPRFSFFDAPQTVEAALDVATSVGIPGQNLIVADWTGRIGWTIAGRIPRRAGFDGRLPVSWADGSRRWDGWLAAEEYPRIVDPPSGRLWTANARTLDGDLLAVLGDGGYDQGARARQIRDSLLALDLATPLDMLAIQLDDRALFLERWRELLVDLLSADLIAGSPARAELRSIVRDGWTGRASVDSAAYRLVRTFRMTLATRVFGALTALCAQADPRFDVMLWRNFEGPLWRLVQEQPPHLLDPRYPSWEAQMLAAVDAVIADLGPAGRDLPARTWGEFNAGVIQHPLSRAMPVLGRWLDMPRAPLPGDHHMPRVQTPREGASQRMVVSPGREAEGILHMPVGQSGHPLSRFYASSHAAWVAGAATPLLPGPAEHVLTLRP